MGVELGIGLGANLIGGFFKNRSEKNRLKQLRRELERNLRQLETQQFSRNASLTESEGNLTNAVTRRAIQGSAQSGTLNSSFTASNVAQAIAPVQAQRAREQDAMRERIFAARNAIATGTSAPGFGSAFGQSFGEAGDILSFLAGRKMSTGGGGLGGGGAVGHQAPDQVDFGDPNNPFLPKGRA